MCAGGAEMGNPQHEFRPQRRSQHGWKGVHVGQEQQRPAGEGAWPGVSRACSPTNNGWGGRARHRLRVLPLSVGSGLYKGSRAVHIGFWSRGVHTGFRSRGH